jgi:hypothetical protein
MTESETVRDCTKLGCAESLSRAAHEPCARICARDPCGRAERPETRRDARPTTPDVCPGWRHLQRPGKTPGYLHRASHDPEAPNGSAKTVFRLRDELSVYLAAVPHGGYGDDAGVVIHDVDHAVATRAQPQIRAVAGQATTPRNSLHEPPAGSIALQGRHELGSRLFFLRKHPARACRSDADYPVRPISRPHSMPP